MSAFGKTDELTMTFDRDSPASSADAFVQAKLQADANDSRRCDSFMRVQTPRGVASTCPFAHNMIHGSYLAHTWLFGAHAPNWFGPLHSC